MNKMINYSVIIPHHNTPELLQRCIDSIPHRDDVEIIIVDDNSDPTIVNFDNFPGNDRTNVFHIFTKEGRGAGFVRNKGVEAAKGKWLVFSDADDYFTPHLQSVMDKYKEDDETDIVFFNALSVNENGKTWSISLNRIVDNFQKHRPFSESIIRYGYWTPWSRMFKREMVVSHNVKFEELPTGNDMMFVLQSTKYARKVEVVTEPLYMYYVPTSGSQTSKKYTKELRDIRLDSRLRLNRFHKEVNFHFTPSVIMTYPVLKDKSIRPILHKYNYNIVSDLVNYCKFYLGKIFKLY